jgi:hypothetical protein
MTENDKDIADIGICPRRKRKKMLHVLNTKPHDQQRTLMNILSLGYHTLEFPLYEENTDEDYDELIELIFEHDQVVSWW